MEKICDAVNITINKNAVHGDSSAFTPGGVRIGLSPLTSRSIKETETIQVAEFLHQAVQIALRIQRSSGKLMKNFVAALSNDPEINNLKQKVQEFAHSLPMPGFDPSTIPNHCRR